MNPYFIFYNRNPINNYGNDCVIRSISLLLDKTWYEVYDNITALGRRMCDMPSSNIVWGQYLFDNGYRKQYSNTDHFNRYDVNCFCHLHPLGKYLLQLKDHVVAVIDGHFYDTMDIGNNYPIMYWYKGDDNYGRRI